MVYGARKRAKQEGLPFILSVDDLVVPTHCPVLGVKMVVGHRDNAPSLDKVVPELGYVKDNVAVMSKRANRIKDNASLAELQQIVSFLKKFFRRQQPSHSATKGVPNGPTNRTRSRRL